MNNALSFALALLAILALSMLSGCDSKAPEGSYAAADINRPGTWEVEVLWEGQECATFKIANFPETEVCITTPIYTHPKPFKAKELIKPSNVAGYVRTPKAGYKPVKVYILRGPKGFDEAPDPDQENPIEQ